MYKDYVALSKVSRQFQRNAFKCLSQPQDSFPLLNSSGIPINSNRKKAGAFNDEFVQNFANIPDSCPEQTFTQGLEANITSELVDTNMHKLSNSSAFPDVISNIFLHLAAPDLVTPLTIIFQCLFLVKIPNA